MSQMVGIRGKSGLARGEYMLQIIAGIYEIQEKIGSGGGGIVSSP